MLTANAGHPRSPLPLVMGTAIVLALFGAVLIALLRARGVCCYDDAAMAVLARSLAEGRGYTLTLSYLGSDYATHAFDPFVGTGPVSVLSVAAAIRLLGAHYWVPGATHVALELILLALAVFLLSRAFSHRRVLLFLVSSLILISLVSARGTLVHWSAQIGEPIAALLVLCGFLAWIARSSSLGGVALAGLLLGLAVLTKELAGIYVMTFVAVVLAQRASELRTQPLGLRDVKVYLTLMVCGVAPFALFELWRLATLGFGGFVSNWRQHFYFIQSYGLRPDGSVDLFESVVQRVSAAEDYYNFSLPAAAVLGALSLYLTRMVESPAMTRAARLLAYGLTIHALYWLLASTGWPRYLHIAVVLWCFLVTLPLLAGALLRGSQAYLVALAIALMFALPQSNVLATVRAGTGARLTMPNEPEQQVIEYLDRHASGEKAYTTWWAHIAASEYFSSRPGRFEGGALKMLKVRGKPLYVVINTRLVKEIKAGPDFAVFDALAQCGSPVFASGPYRIFYCTRD